MAPARLVHHFSRSYEEARARFLAAAAHPGVVAESHLLPHVQGARGETLTLDAALIGGGGQGPLLIVSSGAHGVDGFCGSGCQVALLHDRELLNGLARVHRR